MDDRPNRIRGPKARSIPSGHERAAHQRPSIGPAGASLIIISPYSLDPGYSRSTAKTPVLCLECSCFLACRPLPHQVRTPHPSPGRRLRRPYDASGDHPNRDRSPFF
jgi:hypothetical protein